LVLQEGKIFKTIDAMIRGRLWEHSFQMVREEKNLLDVTWPAHVPGRPGSSVDTYTKTPLPPDNGVSPILVPCSTLILTGHKK
jgi:hypothetical protein